MDNFANLGFFFTQPIHNTHLQNESLKLFIFLVVFIRSYIAYTFNGASYVMLCYVRASGKSRTRASNLRPIESWIGCPYLFYICRYIVFECSFKLIYSFKR